MLMLAIAYHFEGIGYEKTLKNVSEFDKDILKFKNNKMPSSSKLCDFVTKQLSVEKLEKIMLNIASQLYKIQSQKVMIKIANFDSTPVEAARYDKYALYNPHYKCNMYKAHIMMFGVIPLYMKFTDGLTHDNSIIKEFFEKIKPLQLKFHEMNLDGAYDSKNTFAQVWKTFGAKPNIGIRENAVINEIGTIKSINKRINKAWKHGMNIKKPIYEKLDYIYNQGKSKVVGAYFRNQILEIGQGYAYPFRNRQEQTHGNIKKIVKFNVRYVHNKNKELHTLWSFISYQLLSLTALQNSLKINSFGFIY
jgi:hypothetical protein